MRLCRRFVKHFRQGIVVGLMLRSLCRFAQARSSNAEPQVITLGLRLGKDVDTTQRNDKNRRHSSRRFRWSSGAVSMLIIPVSAFGLGVWQTYRLQWKLELIEELRQKLSNDAVPFPIDDLQSLVDMEYRRVRITGEFLNDREFTIGPRGRFDSGYKQKDAGSLLSDNELSSHGVHVITPFRVKGTSLVVMVNRGWVPMNLADRSTRTFTDVTGETTIEAIVRRTEKRPQFVQQNQPEKGIWFYKDFEQMGKRYGTAPIYVEATSESSIPGGPIGGQTNVNIRNDHFNYLCTWFTLCVATSMMWIARFYR